MCSIATALIMLLLLSQVTPAVFCTFKQLPDSAVIKTLKYHKGSPSIKDNIGECMRMCYEDPSCVYVVSYKGGLCSVNPSEGDAAPVSSMTDFYGNHGTAFQLDRNAIVTECPKLEEWLGQNP